MRLLEGDFVYKTEFIEAKHEFADICFVVLVTGGRAVRLVDNPDNEADELYECEEALSLWELDYLLGENRLEEDA